MNSRHTYASILLLCVNICMVDGFCRYPREPFQGMHVTFIHLTNPSATERRSSSFSTANAGINTCYKTENVLQWEKWQVGQGDIGTRNKHSLTEWLNGTFYEQYWESQLPSIIKSSANDDEGNRKTVLKVDGHDFFSRMAIYKYLIQDWEELYSETSLKQLWGSNVHEGHWLWSYAAQLDWQHRSWRLSEPLLENDNKEASLIVGGIAPSSWWGYMNFCFSVAVLIGAVHASNKEGTSCHVELDEESQKLFKEDFASQQCVLIWQQLFSSIYPLYKEKISSALNEGELNENNLQSLRFQFQQEIWKTHTRIIETAVNSPRSKTLLMLLPEAERKFGLGWARMVDILAASTFPTDLVTIVKDGTGFLPFHIVTDQVVADWEKIDKTMDRRSFSELCHQRAVETTHRLADLEDKWFHLVVKFWRRIVRDAKASRSMPSRVNRLVHGSWRDQLVEFGKIIMLFFRP